MALTGDNTRNFEEILEALADADGQVSVSDYTDVDALLFAEISGIDIEKLAGPYSNAFIYNADGTVSYHVDESFTVQELIELYERAYSEDELKNDDKYKLLKAMAESPRYKDVSFTGFVNSKDQAYKDEQGNEYIANYKAVTVEVPDGKIISYAGTGASIFSWIEDGRMACADEGIGAQVWGKEYAEYMMNKFGEDDFSFCGYSKGGNQALYTTAMLFEEYSDRIRKTINVDGPGFSEDRLDLDVNGKPFREILAELYERGIIIPTATPYTSFVGSLMENHLDYVYLDADAWLMFLNHDYTYWNVILDENGVPSFSKSDVTMPTEASQAFDRVVDGLLSSMSDEELDQLMDALDSLCAGLRIGTVTDMQNFLTSEDKSISQKIQAALSVCEGMDEEQRAALNKLLQGLMADENLEDFLTAWRKELETSTSADARNIADMLLKAEPYYPVIASVLEGMDTETLLHAAKIVCGYLEKIGGVKSFENMSSLDIAVSIVDYFMDLSWIDKGKTIVIIGKGVLDIAADYAKEHPIIACLAAAVVIFIIVNPAARLAAKIILGVIAGAALIAMLWDEYGDDIIRMAQSVAEWVGNAFDKIRDEIMSAIEALRNALMNMLENLWDKFLDLLSWAGNEIKEFMAQFDTETHKEIKELHVRINEPIYYTAKSIHSAAETRLELDLNAIDSLSSRMDRTASKATRLESLLDSLRWKLQYQEVETEDEKKISLAEKYNVSSGALSVNQAGILRAGAGRLTDAAAALRAMDGRLLR